MLEKWIQIFCHMTIYFPSPSFLCVVLSPNPEKQFSSVPPTNIWCRHTAQFNSKIQSRRLALWLIELVKSKQCSKQWLAVSLVVHYVWSDLLDVTCVLQIGSLNITVNTRDWSRMQTPQTVLANSVIYCTKVSAAKKLMGSPHRQGSKVKTRQNSPNRKTNLSKSEEKRYNLQK